MLSRGVRFSPSQGTHEKGSAVGDHRRNLSGAVKDHRGIQDPLVKFPGVFRQSHSGNGASHRMSEKHQRESRILFFYPGGHIAQILYIPPKAVNMDLGGIPGQTIGTPVSAVFGNIYGKAPLIEIPGQFLIFFCALAEAVGDQDHSPGIFPVKRKTEDLPSLFSAVIAFPSPGVKTRLHIFLHLFRKIFFI